MSEAVLEATEKPEVKTDNKQFIECKICGAKVHSIEHHLKSAHESVTVNDYKLAYPGADLLSPTALALINKAKKTNPATQAASAAEEGKFSLKPMHELFKLGNNPLALSTPSKNKPAGPIPIKVLHDGDFADMVPQYDSDYVINVENLKNALIAIEFNFTLYLWGHTGVGKTTLVELICAATNRPYFRFQHSIGTEETDVVGSWVARNGETQFELGPLALAMKYGWVFLADEYDFAIPSVVAVYQAVLEGKPLVIKGADAANRVIKPHPNFRFVATGNTNGSGDEQGIYQGTQIQNAANYDRFNVVVKVDYLPKSEESRILSGKAGIMVKDAERFVNFAENVRNDYNSRKLSLPVSPRTLIRAAQLGVIKGNFLQGIMLAYTNKLNANDKAVVDGYAQRLFG